MLLARRLSKRYMARFFVFSMLANMQLDGGRRVGLEGSKGRNQLLPQIGRRFSTRITAVAHPPTFAWSVDSIGDG